MYLAERLEVRTIVEGVETKEQVEFIRKLNCDVILRLLLFKTTK